MNNHKGMLLETLINQTIKHYQEQNIAIIHKKWLDIKFSAIDQNKKIKNGVIVSKSTVDYYGIYRGQFIAFEAKSVAGLIIPKSNFKEHQHRYLQQINKHGGQAFYIFFFKQTNECFLINILKMKHLSQQITWQFIKKTGILLEIKYPGIIDFIKFL